MCDECGAEYEEGTWKACKHKYNGHNLDNGAEYIKRYKQAKSEIPKRYEDAFDQLTGSGRGIDTVQAAICYVESGCTQQIAADIFGVTGVSVRNRARDLVEMGVVDVDEIWTDTNHQQFAEFRAEQSDWKPQA